MVSTRTVGLRSVAAAAVAAMVGGAALAPAAAGQTQVTYQGRLLDAGTPAHGAFDMTFRLFDAASGGVQVGTTVGPVPVNVADGLFTASLDFGAGAYADNSGRWLEIDVEGALLAPRQRLTGAPRSLTTRGFNVAPSGSVETDIGGSGSVLHLQQTQFNGAYFATSNYGPFIGQSFVPANPVLTAVDIKIAHASLPWDAFIRIREGEGTDGTLLYQSGTFTGPTGTNPAPITRSLPSIPVTPGQPYTLEIRASNGVQVHRQSTDVYPNGMAFNSVAQPTHDLYFRTYGRDRADLTVGALFIPTIASSNGVAIGWDAARGGEITVDTSSSRFKENIADLAAPFERLLDARPKTYTRPGRPGTHEIGYIAEEFAALGLEELLHRDTQGQPFSVNYPKMAMYLVEIARAQRAVLAERAADLEALRAEMAELRAAVGALNNTPEPR